VTADRKGGHNKLALPAAGHMRMRLYACICLFSYPIVLVQDCSGALMTPQLWIGFGFLALLVLFLMLAYFVKDKASPNQYNILRFLTALCAGFAGGFLAGEALFHLDATIAGGAKIALSGTAGCALFFSIWFTYPKQPDPTPPLPLADRCALSIPDGWTFEQAVRAIVKAARAAVVFEGFQAAQVEAKLTAGNIDAPSARDALEQLKYQSTALPPYTVDLKKGVYHIQVGG
jgi:hypothetical protein